jgi:predicted DNA-binding transcriptional regulator AlpA
MTRARDRSATEPPERIQGRAVAAITGLTVRTVQLLSIQGRIPSAAKLGGRWTYDEMRVRQWIKREEARCQTAAASEGERLADSAIQDAYDRALGRGRYSRRNATR